MYRTVSEEVPKDEPLNTDMVVLFTPAGVDSLLYNFPNFKELGIKLACFGPATKKAMENAGLDVELSAPTEAARSMTTALDIYLDEHKA